jgi:hypothetical protein
MEQINEEIAIEVLKWEKGNFKCIDGKKFIYRDLHGSVYSQNDSCFPDFYNNDAESIALLSRFTQWEITKYSDKQFKVHIRNGNKTAEAIAEKLSQSIAKASLLAVRM